MSKSDQAVPRPPRIASQPIVFWLAIALVTIGMINAMPGIPGLDQLARDLTGNPMMRIRKFPLEYFYPLVFLLMMVIAVLANSVSKAWRTRSIFHRRLGLTLDVAMLAVSILIAFAYLNQNPAVCLIDQITGERAALIAKAMEIEKANAAMFGLPVPGTVDDPDCINTLGGWLVVVMTLTCAVFLAYTAKVWGLPLVVVAIIVFLYAFGTVAIWYVFGAEDMNRYLVTKLGGEPRSLADGYPRLQDALVSNSSGLFGKFLGIIVNEIFPYLVLGALFGTSAGGKSMIKLAFRWTRRLNGGPAHAAIMSSAMFGTVSGGPVTNVLSTGVLTIPMMLKSGFSRTFAGGVEAAASSGGSIMPPVMGVAAFILAAITAVPYSEVIVAAVIPAIAYFLCLFLTVVFEARKMNIKALGELTPDMHIDRQDKLNLLMILLPILMILIILLTRKEGVGCGLLGQLLGAVRTFGPDGICQIESLSWFLRLYQNAAGDVGSAGWWAVILLLGLLFLDPVLRREPGRLLDGLADAGITMSTLYLMFLAVAIIDFCLNFTGLPFYISVDVLAWLNGLGLGQEGTTLFQFIALAATMMLAILLGMGMPAVPAYVNVALLMGPVLAGLGLSIFTANMFIFYYAVASAITPPVAVAAFAAASITRAEPMATSFAAVRAGIVMFVIPFIFAFHPELLLINAAVLDPAAPTGTVQYLPGYDGEVHIGPLAWLFARVILALYLVASAFAAYDAGKLGTAEIWLRLLLAVLVLFKPLAISGIAVVASLALIYWHWSRTSQRRTETAI